MSKSIPPFTQNVTRRSWLRAGTSFGATAAAWAAFDPRTLFGQVDIAAVTAGDIAILKFLAAAELVEDDLWQQYCELAVNNRAFNQALGRIDPALVRYVCDDRDDERSHANLINAFLAAIGQEPINLDAFRVLPSVAASGAENTGRLTSLTNLTVDTSWFLRYRSPLNPDLGAVFPQFLEIKQRPTVPLADHLSQVEIQAAAHSAAFHFAAIEQGGGSLYASLITKASSLDVVRILASIGPTEVYHFAAFHKSLENLPGLRAPDGLEFPDLRRDPGLAHAIFPEPCQFLQSDFPPCSVIRPGSTANAGAVAAAAGLVQSGLFEGQSPQFFDAVGALAVAADSAVREA